MNGMIRNIKGSVSTVVPEAKNFSSQSLQPTHKLRCEHHYSENVRDAAQVCRKNHYSKYVEDASIDENGETLI